tara:strand:- start:100 stop:375 length:276 start_codon:yes stop_codon:yes gene_type:complete
MKQNLDLTKEIVPTDSELKEIIVDYVGNKLNPEEDAITVEQVIKVFADQFPEMLLALAEENWVNGYTQALNDVEYMKDKNVSEEVHNKKKS